MKQEAATLKAIQDWLEMEGYLYVRINPTRIIGKGKFVRVRASQKGAPDLIVFLMGVAVCFEVKSQEGKQSLEQKTWAERATENNIRYFVVRNFDEFLLLMPPAWRRGQ